MFSAYTNASCWPFVSSATFCVLKSLGSGEDDCERKGGLLLL